MTPAPSDGCANDGSVEDSGRTVRISRSVRTVARPSQRILEVAAMFGLEVDDQVEHVIVPECEIPLPCGGVVFITGPSGGGKSTILRAVLEAGRKRWGARVIRIAKRSAGLPDHALVDLFDRPLDATLALLSRAGLGEAFVLLRRPSELSDGQRARLALARAMDEAERARAPCLIAADEFAATLDRLTAQSLARQVRRWVSTTRHTFIAATTHDDLLESLAPDVLVYKDLGPGVQVCESWKRTLDHLVP